MSSFFLAVELFSYAFAVFLFFKKKELAIVYLPVIIFANKIIVPVVPAIIYYAVISALVFSLIFNNPSYYKKNIPAFLLFLYILILLPRSSDLVLIRPFVFSMLWLLTLIPTINTIYQKYTRKEVFGELAKSAAMILLIFIANALISTIKGYAPKEMYGITSGILYGNIIAEDFNILAIAIFITTLGVIEKKRFVPFVILVVAFSFIMLSLRRSVMGISFLGVGIAYLTLFTKEKAKMFFMFGGIALVLSTVIYFTTDIADQFKERYELRKLDERDLEEEKRFFEYELLYKDMFIYRDYSPLIGYELFNSWGNYGRGALEERSLHGDITSIIHSTGFIGLLLYFAMVLTAFRSSYKHAVTRTDRLIIFFCALAFTVYTITGRYTEIGATLLLYLILLLPLAKLQEEKEDQEIEVPQLEDNAKLLAQPTTLTPH